jgi:hypothetical protein
MCLNAGHEITGSLTHFATEADAAAAFADASGGDCYASIEYRGLPAERCCIRALTPEPCVPNQDRSEWWVWCFGCWVATIHAFDDTHFREGPEPQTVSDIFYAVGNAFALFPGCTS